MNSSQNKSNDKIFISDDSILQRQLKIFRNYNVLFVPKLAPAEIQNYKCKQ